MENKTLPKEPYSLVKAEIDLIWDIRQYSLSGKWEVTQYQRLKGGRLIIHLNILEDDRKEIHRSQIRNG